MPKINKYSTSFITNLWQILSLAGAMFVYVFLVDHYNFTQDDAFISFRYAQNFLDGHGLVYNIGERIEGYTNFLWTIILILGGRLGLNFVEISQVLGALFGLATIVLSYFTARLIFRNIPGIVGRLLPGICCLILGTIYSFAYWSAAGLETSAFAFMVLLAIFSYMQRSYIVIPALVLATLLRPEGGLVFAFIVLYEVMCHRRWNHYFFTISIIYISYLLPFFVFRLQYYDSFLPNSFYAKTSFSLQQIVHGLDYTWLFIRHYLGHGVFLIPAILAFRRASPEFRISMIFLFVYTGYIILIGGDVLKVHRFFVPLLPLFIMSVICGFYMAFTRRGLYLMGIAALIISQLILPHKHVTAFYQAEIALNKNMNTMMDHLQEADRSNFSLATSTIGLVGFRLMGHTVIDLLGLTDSTIARHPEPPIEGMKTTWRESHFNSRYVLLRQPDYILFSTGFKPSAPAEQALFLHSSFLKCYRTVGFFYFSNLHSVFKRYHSVDDDIKRDIDIRFVRSFVGGIDRLIGEDDYTGALGSFGEAERILGDSAYPYLHYYSSIAFGKLGNFDTTRVLLQKMIELDTLAFEGYLGLCTYACADGDRDKYRFYRSKLANLTPWYLPRIDSMCEPILK